MKPSQHPADARDNLSRDTLSRDTGEIRPSPPLSAEDERALCYRWRDRHDIAAAHQLFSNHLHLVIETSRDCRGYGLPFEDLVGEGQAGLMRAVCRFEPDRGVRFATYAHRWVRAAIQQYILRNWWFENNGASWSRAGLERGGDSTLRAPRYPWQGDFELQM